MINLVPIRAAIAAASGQPILVTPDQLEQLLTEVDDGRAAKRELRMLSAVATSLPGSIEGSPA